MNDFDAGRRAMIRAREADNQLWSPASHGTGHYREIRDKAVLDAINAGVPLEQIADDLGVLISDVESMAAAARNA